MSDNTPKYEAPRIEDHGDLTELTAGKSAGKKLDAAFPALTDFADLTFTTPTK